MAISAEAAGNILLVEDSATLSATYSAFLVKAGYQVTAVEDGKSALQALRNAQPDAMLLDIQLPDMNGMQVLEEIGRSGLSVLTIVMTANASISNAVNAMKHGAHDFLVKPFNADRLLATLSNAIRIKRLENMVASLKPTLERGAYHGFIGSSLGMAAVYRTIDQAAPSRATIFITGESGTGKEVCAEAIHRQSPRHKQPFIALNCAAIPKDLIESEIFGHVKGAFTGAVSDRDGAATQAEGGTLFLDEIAEMDVGLQTKLLRFLQTGTFRRVGGSKLEQADIRIICATNRDPLAEVHAGRFREDLYYRLHVVPILLPPLRERQGDALEIARYFLHKFAAEDGKAFTDFAPDAQHAIARYAWPGNVRELQNVVRNITVLHDGNLVTAAMLPSPLDGLGGEDSVAHSPQLSPQLSPAGPLPPVIPPTQISPSPKIQPLWRLEEQAIEAALEACSHNVPRAAALLEINPSTLYRKLEARKKR